MTDQLTSINLAIRDILQLLPHRYPFMLVDRVVELVPGKSIKAYKCVSFNEPFFQGHFPGLPVMPGVLIIEALAQNAALMVLHTQGAALSDKVFLFSGMENVKFRRPVVPGDRLDLDCTLIRQKFNIWKTEARAYVDGQIAAEAVLTAALIDKERM